MKVLVLSYVNNIQAILTYFDQMKLQCETLCVFMELMWKEKGKINHLSVVKIQSLNYKTFVPLGQFKFYTFYSPPFIFSVDFSCHCRYVYKWTYPVYRWEYSIRVRFRWSSGTRALSLKNKGICVGEQLLLDTRLQTSSAISIHYTH